MKIISVVLGVDPSECDCRGGQCDPRSGECRCPDGMTGKQCDVCSRKYSVPVEEHHNMHCEREQHTHTHTEVTVTVSL